MGRATGHNSYYHARERTTNHDAGLVVDDEMAARDILTIITEDRKAMRLYDAELHPHAPQTAASQDRLVRCLFTVSIPRRDCLDGRGNLIAFTDC